MFVEAFVGAVLGTLAADALKRHAPAWARRIREASRSDEELRAEALARLRAQPDYCSRCQTNHTTACNATTSMTFTGTTTGDEHG